MAKTLSGWSRVKSNERYAHRSGDLAHYKETITFGDGSIADCICSEFGKGIAEGEGATEFVPNPPPGVDFTAMLIHNNTISVACPLDLQGAEKSAGTFSTLKADLVAGTAGNGGTSTVGQYVQQPGITPTGGRAPVFRFFMDMGTAIASTGTDKTSEIHITWIIP